MAQTKRKRRTKHRGTAAGTVQARGRTSRPPTAAERKKMSRAELREERMNKKPTWRSSVLRAAMGAAMMFLVLLFIGPKKDRISYSVLFTLFALIIYIPAGFYIETFLWRRRQRQKAQR